MSATSNELYGYVLPLSVKKKLKIVSAFHPVQLCQNSVRASKARNSDHAAKKKRKVLLTSFTPGSWLSLHAISMQGVFINLCKSSHSCASETQQYQDTDRPNCVTTRTDSDTSFDYPVLANVALFM